MPSFPQHRHLHAYVHQGRIGVLVELGSESRAVTEDLAVAALIHDLALQIASQDPSDVAALLGQRAIRDPNVTVEQLVAETSKVCREPLVVTRFVRWDAEAWPQPEFPIPPHDPAVAVSAKRP
jgi:elongation factor Ts